MRVAHKAHKACLSPLRLHAVPSPHPPTHRHRWMTRARRASSPSSAACCCNPAGSAARLGVAGTAGGGCGRCFRFPGDAIACASGCVGRCVCVRPSYPAFGCDAIQRSRVMLRRRLRSPGVSDTRDRPRPPSARCQQTSPALKSLLGRGWACGVPSSGPMHPIRGGGPSHPFARAAHLIRPLRRHPGSAALEAFSALSW